MLYSKDSFVSCIGNTDCILPLKQCVHYSSHLPLLHKTKRFNPQWSKRKYVTSKILSPWILIFKRQNLEYHLKNVSFLVLWKQVPGVSLFFTLGKWVQGSPQFHTSSESSYCQVRSSEREKAWRYTDLGPLPSRRIQSHDLILGYLKF